MDRRPCFQAHCGAVMLRRPSGRWGAGTSAKPSKPFAAVMSVYFCLLRRSNPEVADIREFGFSGTDPRSEKGPHIVFAESNKPEPSLFRTTSQPRLYRGHHLFGLFVLTSPSSPAPSSRLLASSSHPLSNIGETMNGSHFPSYIKKFLVLRLLFLSVHCYMLFEQLDCFFV